MPVRAIRDTSPRAQPQAAYREPARPPAHRAPPRPATAPPHPGPAAAGPQVPIRARWSSTQGPHRRCHRRQARRTPPTPAGRPAACSSGDGGGQWHDAARWLRSSVGSRPRPRETAPDPGRSATTLRKPRPRRHRERVHANTREVRAERTDRRPRRPPRPRPWRALRPASAPRRSPPYGDVAPHPAPRSPLNPADTVHRARAPKASRIMPHSAHDREGLDKRSGGISRTNLCRLRSN